MSDADLRGKLAVVTGAGRGIGRAIALGLAERGAHVVLAARTAEQIERVAAEIAERAAAATGSHAAAGGATPVVADVSDADSVVALFAAADAIGPVDVLVNNAGVGRYGPVAEFAVEDFDHVTAVNLRGTFLCCREAMRRMGPRGSGFIINIASVVGFKGYVNQAAYTAGKHGVMGLTKSLAAEAQPSGVRVSAVLPGGVDTEMVAASRPDLDRDELLSPEDVAGAVLYLLSLSDRAHVDQIYIRRRGSAPF
ncbi:MAG: SDR family oxidoreductase [Phycisphaerae bacterium]|nr:SDR family oxidoreductase [Phycisphaerae bacterium]